MHYNNQPDKQTKNKYQSRGLKIGVKWRHHAAINVLPGFIVRWKQNYIQNLVSMDWNSLTRVKSFHSLYTTRNFLLRFWHLWKTSTIKEIVGSFDFLKKIFGLKIKWQCDQGDTLTLSGPISDPSFNFIPFSKTEISPNKGTLL